MRTGSHHLGLWWERHEEGDSMVSWLGRVRVASSCAKAVGAMEESCLAPEEGHLLGEERKH